ncbi:hypothetical protein [Nocardia arthritidis]|nr:hypothetical protein [Nocardia arthritidis]
MAREVTSSRENLPSVSAVVAFTAKAGGNGTRRDVRDHRQR